MKYLTLSAVVAAGLMIAGSAYANGGPVGGCPKGGDWESISVASIVVDPVVDVGNFKDQNGDDTLCRFLMPNNDDNGRKLNAVWKDNNNKLPD